MGSSRTGQLAALLCFAAAAAFAIYRTGFGIPGPDEGYYLATASRLALGDVPFRDEIFNPLRMFDLILWPVFAALPDITVRDVRLLWLPVQLGAMLALTGLLSRFAPLPLVAFACACAIWIPNLIWTPAYYVMGITFFTLSWSLWLLGCLAEGRRSAVLLGAASGAVLFLGAVAYVPLLGVEIVPFGVLVRELTRPQGGRSWRDATLVHLGVLGLAALSLVSVIAATGLLPDWWNAAQAIASARYYAKVLSDGSTGYLRQLAPYLGMFTASVAAALMLCFARPWLSRPRWGTWLCAIASAAILLGLYWIFFEVHTQINISGLKRLGRLAAKPFPVVVVLLGLQLGLLLHGPTRRSLQGVQPAASTVGTFLTGTLILGFFFAFLSNMAFKGFFAAPPLAACVIVALYRALAPPGSASATRGRAAIIAASVCLAVAALGYTARFPHHYTGLKPCSHPRLAGIVDRPLRVGMLEAVLDYLAPRVEPGDLLLAYDDIPLLYFLTGTRPGLDVTWSSRAVPAALLKRSILKMRMAGRIPRYAVRLRNILGGKTVRSAVDRWVGVYYSEPVVIGLFEVRRLGSLRPSVGVLEGRACSGGSEGRARAAEAIFGCADFDAELDTLLARLAELG